MSKYEYNEVFDKFKQYYPIIATRVVDWYRSGKNSIIMRMDDGSKMQYHSGLNTIRTMFSYSEDDFTEENYQRDFSYNLISKMADASFNQVLLSEKTGISQVSINKYINRKALPSIYNCEKIARALGCTVDELTKQEY